MCVWEELESVDWLALIYPIPNFHFIDGTEEKENHLKVYRNGYIQCDVNG